MSTLKSPKSNLVIQPQQFIDINSRGKADIAKIQTPVLFIPNETAPWQPGLEIKDTLATLPNGKSFRIKIRVHNSTKHPVTLRNRTPIGRLELIKTATPFEVKSKMETGIREVQQPRFENNDLTMKLNILSATKDREIGDFLGQSDFNSLAVENSIVPNDYSLLK